MVLPILLEQWNNDHCLIWNLFRRISSKMLMFSSPLPIRRPPSPPPKLLSPCKHSPTQLTPSPWHPAALPSPKLVELPILLWQPRFKLSKIQLQRIVAGRTPWLTRTTLVSHLLISLAAPWILLPLRSWTSLSLWRNPFHIREVRVQPRPFLQRGSQKLRRSIIMMSVPVSRAGRKFL